MKVDVRYRGRATVTCPAGTLDMATYRPLRDALLRCAAEQPDALLVDVAELEMPSAHALTVFSSVASQVSAWPGIRVLLVATDAEQRAMLRVSSIQRFVAIHDSVPAAIAAMDDPPVRSRAEIDLPPSGLSTRRARYFARMNCIRWQVPELITDTMTVVTSLVENTLLHTDSMAFLQMELRRGLLTIAVSDEDPRPAVLRERAEGGVAPSGLLLVSAVAETWGCTPTMTGGKTVWAALRSSQSTMD
jgi:anti-anti-sigma regulatory factor